MKLFEFLFGKKQVEEEEKKVCFDEDEVISKDKRSQLPNFNDVKPEHVKDIFRKYYDELTEEEISLLLKKYYSREIYSWDDLIRWAVEEKSTDTWLRKMIFQNMVEGSCSDFIKNYKATDEEIKILLDKFTVISKLLDCFRDCSNNITSDQMMMFFNKAEELFVTKKSPSLSDYLYNDIISFRTVKIEDQKVINKMYELLLLDYKNEYTYRIFKNNYNPFNEEQKLELLKRLKLSEDYVTDLLSNENIFTKEEYKIFIKIALEQNFVTSILRSKSDMTMWEFKTIVDDIINKKNTTLAKYIFKNYNSTLKRFPEEKDIIDSMVTMDRLSSVEG